MSGHKCQESLRRRNMLTSKNKSKTISLDTSIEREKQTKNPNLIYVDRNNQEKTWMNEKKLEKLTGELLEWSLKPEALKMSIFFKEKGIDYLDVEEWAKKWPEFKRTYRFVKERIGDRRELGSIHKQFNEQTILRSMPLYDAEWKEESERVARLRDEQIAEEAKRQIIVEMHDYSDKKKGKDGNTRVGNDSVGTPKGR